MRNVARHAVQREQRGVSVRAADMHMLAENRELFGQVTVKLGQFAKTRFVVNAALVPLLKRMRAAAHHGNVELVGAFDQSLADLRELPQYF